MPGVNAFLVFLGLSALFAVLAVGDYLGNDHQLTIAGRNHRRMAVVFGVVVMLLLVVR